MPRRVRIAVGALAGLCLLSAAAASAQTALNWSADDATRVAALTASGRRIEGTDVIVFHPPSLVPSDADRLLRLLDWGVPALRKRVGVHDWQAVPAGRITYYLSDDTFVSHASGQGAVFVPMARVMDGRAPYFHEAAHELLASNRRGSPPNADGGGIRRPLWLTEGLADYVAQLVVTDTGITETGPFATGGLSGADATCAERAKTPDGATMLQFVGGPGRPEALFTTDRGRFAPTFYTCALSFTKFVAGRAGLEALIEAVGAEPAQTIARLDTLGARPLAAHRADWLGAIGLR